ncbi:hypothetical protein [Leisingera sp. M527]|uniref:hypothetical protein n=1 Tax=Leisingera sp. M527 TaxID=2867014 RepID=UPI0021A316A1|nr:hypothetical protein [Leisingera sp. M527]
MKIAGRSFWLWHAVDQEGAVLEEIPQSRRNMRAADLSPGATVLSQTRLTGSNNLSRIRR